MVIRKQDNTQLGRKKEQSSSDSRDKTIVESKVYKYTSSNWSHWNSK
jgi:hypothetical protein